MAPNSLFQSLSNRRRDCLLLLALVAAIYAVTLQNGLVFDDRAVIGGHATLSSLKEIPRLAISPYWSGEGLSNRLYRPLTSLCLAVNEALGRGSPWTFHVVNLLLHAWVSITLYLLLERLFGDRWMSLTASVLFAVHPLLTEAVASIVGRSELLAALFVLGALALDRESARGVGASLLPPALYFLALLSKENALAYPGVVGWTDWVLGRPAGISRRRRVRDYCLLLGVAFAYLLLRRQVLGSLMEPESIPAVDNPLVLVSGAKRILTALFLTAKFLGLFLLPLWLSAEYSSPQILPVSSWHEPGVMLGGLAVLVLAALAIRLRSRLPPLSWGLGFTACTYFLVSNLPFPIGTIFAERLFYLPAVGLCTVAGLIMSAVHHKHPRALLAAFVGIAAVMGGRSWVRNLDWKDDFTLFRSAAQTCPRSAKVHYNLANAYRRRGDLTQAASHYRTSLELYPAFDAASRNLAVTLTDLGEGEEAVALLRQALAKNPGSASLENNLGNAYRVTGMGDQAEQSYRSAIQLDPAGWDAHINLAVLYQERGNLDLAEQELEEAIHLCPTPAPLLVQLGDFRLKAGRPREALEAFSQAESAAPELPAALRGEGEALMGMGRLDEAETALHRSLSIDPDQWEAPALLGFLSQQKGDDSRAEKYYLTSLHSHPEQPELRQNLGVLYERQPGGREKAREQFRLCLALNPDESTARKVRAMLEDLEKGERGTP